MCTFDFAIVLKVALHPPTHVECKSVAHTACSLVSISRRYCAEVSTRATANRPYPHSHPDRSLGMPPTAAARPPASLRV